MLRRIGHDEQVNLNADYYALMISYFSQSDVKSWEKRREQLALMLCDDVIIYQLPDASSGTGIAMKNDTILRRILYAGTGLAIIVTLILAFLVIPSVIIDTSPQADPESAVPVILFVILIHPVIVAALVQTFLVYQRGGRIEKGLLIGPGVLLLLLSLIVSDGASAYSDHTDPIMKRVSFSMFICTGCNFIAGLLTLLTAWYSIRYQPPLE